jgi:hypothetical protein
VPDTKAPPASPWEQLFLENQAAWDARVGIHAASAFYDVAGFKAGALSLTAMEQEHLGPITGRSVLHLQCHFGLDTLSLTRLGAAPVGVDFSSEAVAYARGLASELSLAARFVEGCGSFARHENG